MRQLIYIVLMCLFFLSACSQTDDPKLAFEKGDYERALELWTPLADAGDLDAMNYLGVHHLLGLGTKKDHVKASQWYEKAAKAGHADAQKNYGDMMYNGFGVQQDVYQAFIWYFAASQQGSASAKTQLEALSGNNKLTPNQQMHGKIEANKYIMDPGSRFMSHDTYVDKNKKIGQPTDEE